MRPLPMPPAGTIPRLLKLSRTRMDLAGVAARLAMLATMTLGACARPAGPLFEPVRPARYWPGPPERARIRLLGELGDSDDLNAGRSGGESFARILRGPRPPIPLVGPHAVAVADPDLLAVADGAGAAVHILDLGARTHCRVLGWADQRFGVPVGVTWAGHRLFVSDARRGEIVELTRNGDFRGQFGAGILQRPVGLVYVTARRHLYVVDGGAHTINVFNLSGSLITRIGGQGIGPGEFNFPTHICNKESIVAVADSGNARVQLLDLDGTVRIVIGGRGDAAGDFSLPKGVAFDREGHLYVVDAQFENIQIFDQEGNLLLSFGEEGRALGNFWLPAGLAIDDQDRIWVADGGNHRIQVFEYLGA